MMQKVYQVVTQEGAKCLNKEDLLSKYKQIGTNNNPLHRLELIDEPKLKGFYGPMYNGDNGVTCMIRYEAQEIPNSVDAAMLEIVANGGNE